MCGIVGILGKPNYYSELKELLSNISYRGYDSCGISIVGKESFNIIKIVGHPEGLPDSIDTEDSTIGFGHDRWASHGGITKENAHPHLSNDKKISVVHNGIIENYVEIRNFLTKEGYTFYSETDTEVIPNLIQYWYEKCNDIEKTLNTVFSELKGAYAFVMAHLDYPGKLFLARLGSPLCIGIDSGVFYISSDIPSLPYFVKKTVVLENSRYAILESGKNIIIKHFSGADSAFTFEELSAVQSTYTKDGYKYFLEKEIFEQPEYIRTTLAGRVNPQAEIIKLGGIESHLFKLLKTEEFIFTGCGSAFYASQVGAYAMESLARVKSKAISAGELQYYDLVANDKTSLVSVTQSGETADTIGCINNFKKKGSATIGIVNVVSSTISRMVDCGIYIRSGKEASVASTKSVTNQILNMIMMAAMLGSKGTMPTSQYISLINELYSLPDKVSKILSKSDDIRKICEIYKDRESLLVIGRDKLEPIAKEYALKIKEISYIHAEGYSGSELKHGPLALINSERPTIALVENNILGIKMMANIKEITSRGGHVIGVFEEGCPDEIIESTHYSIIIPSNENKILNTITFLIVGQLISLHLADLRGCSVDRPINLAKSLTIE
jgi:glucosamine--fructose-6-phosphate aminotransferase (isomerizing)